MLISRILISFNIWIYLMNFLTQIYSLSKSYIIHPSQYKKLRKVLTVPIVISLMLRSESPSLRYCIAFFWASFAVTTVLEMLFLHVDDGRNVGKRRVKLRQDGMRGLILEIATGIIEEVLQEAMGSLALSKFWKLFETNCSFCVCERGSSNIKSRKWQKWSLNFNSRFKIVS